MKRAFFLLLLVSGINFYSSAQTTPALKDRIIGKWIYLGTEEFGVITLDSLQKKDEVTFVADGNYNRIFKGKTESGTYKVTESTRQIFLTDAMSKKTTMYKLKSATGTELTLDFQTPDLVHTLYKFKKAE